MYATVTDEALVEMMIMGFRENEAYLPEFEAEVKREASRLIFTFRRVYGHSIRGFRSSIMFGERDVISLEDQGLFVPGGDTLALRYTLSWRWYGGGDGPAIWTPAPSGLKLDLCIVA